MKRVYMSFLYAGMAWGIARCEIAVVYGTCDSLHNNSGNNPHEDKLSPQAVSGWLKFGK